MPTFQETSPGPYPGGGQGPEQKQAATIANSLLIADCGTVFTKVSLFGLVEGQYRLMARGEAPTTLGAPQEDITTGITQAIQDIEFTTGRHFLKGKEMITPEQDNGDGVDVFISTASAGGPLRLVVLGGVSQELEHLVAQSLSGLYAEPQTLVAPSYQAMATQAPVSVAAGGRPSAPGANVPWNQERVALEWERQLGQLRELQPHAALIVGMVDTPAGPNALQEACQLLVNAFQERQDSTGTNVASMLNDGSKRISVLYAGAPQYVEAVRRMLNGVADVTRIDPLVSQEQVGKTSVSANALHDRVVMKQMPGFDLLASWSSSAPIATATSLSSLVRFLAQHYAMNVTAVDIGGATSTIMLAGEQGEFIPTVSTGVGVGPGLGAILQRAGLQRIIRWLPFKVTEDEMRQFVLNHMLHPQALPSSERELQTVQAFAREAIALTVEQVRRNVGEWPESDLILATGGVLAHAPKYGQIALMLLDALQPRGVTSMVLDRTMLIPVLGAVASVSPIAAVQVNENDAVTHRLGTCVVPFGDLPAGSIAVKVGVEYSNGRQLSVDVMTGTIEVIPLRLNEQALLTLFPAPTVDVGLGLGERARAAEEIDGGLVGLIIDARGRPLQLPTDDTERQARLQQWSQAMGA
jgi:hypothetical protein